MKFSWRDSNGRIAFCFFEILQVPNDKVAVIFTEVAGNSGLSITNDCELLATRFFIEMLKRHDIKPHAVKFIEHYTDAPERWDEVVFGEIETKPIVRYGKPTWHRVTKPEGKPIQK